MLLVVNSASVVTTPLPLSFASLGFALSFASLGFAFACLIAFGRWVSRPAAYGARVESGMSAGGTALAEVEHMAYLLRLCLLLCS